MKPWYQSLTVWTNVLTFIVALASIADELPLTPSARSYLLASAAVANIAIRVFLTEKPIGGKDVVS